MHYCFDVGYSDDTALVATVGFENWTDTEPSFENTQTISNIEPYESGKFYLRELPCLFAAIESTPQPPTTLLIDGNVRLDNDRPGLGQHLFDALNAIDEAVPVIGVAKSEFQGLTTAVEILRGDSSRPLFVTATGMNDAHAADLIKSMAGPFRIPTLLKLVDKLSRGN